MRTSAQGALALCSLVAGLGIAAIATGPAAAATRTTTASDLPDFEGPVVSINRDSDPVSAEEGSRQTTSESPGYHEISFGPTVIGGRQAVAWNYEVEGDRRVVYGFIECGGGPEWSDRRAQSISPNSLRSSKNRRLVPRPLPELRKAVRGWSQGSPLIPRHSVGIAFSEDGAADAR